MERQNGMMHQYSTNNTLQNNTRQNAHQTKSTLCAMEKQNEMMHHIMLLDHTILIPVECRGSGNVLTININR